MEKFELHALHGCHCIADVWRQIGFSWESGFKGVSIMVEWMLKVFKAQNKGFGIGIVIRNFARLIIGVGVFKLSHVSSASMAEAVAATTNYGGSADLAIGPLDLRQAQ
ncbi:hypothetical protein REPUB_Repub18cG0004400 [Reevesia pubescens]